MGEVKSENQWAGLGLLTAVSASLCCITPVLALLAGTSGFASTFAWLDPLRPYLIGLTALVLGVAWYQKLKPKTQADCDCDVPERTPFMHTKKFLALVTIVAGLMLVFPSYAHVFFPNQENKVAVTSESKPATVEFTVVGMTCTGCEEHVAYEVNQLAGVIKSTVSYKHGNAIVAFDQRQTGVEAIEEAIEKTGYAVSDKKAIE